MYSEDRGELNFRSPQLAAKFESLDPIHRRRVHVGVRVHEQTHDVRAQYAGLNY